MQREEEEEEETKETAAFADYFLVCGLDIDGDLRLDLSAAANFGVESEDEEEGGMGRRPPLERSYVGRVLDCFPQVQGPARRRQISTDDILALCLPRGVRFCTQKEVPSVPTFHNFANIREDGSRLDGCALSFWEEVANASMLDAMHELHTSHVRQITTMTGAEGDEQLLKNSYIAPGTVSGGCHTLPRKGAGGSARARHRQLQQQQHRVSYFDSAQDRLFVTKAICLVGQLAVVSAAESLLRSLERMFGPSSSGSAALPPPPPPLPLDSYVYWIVNEVPLPSAGSTVRVSIEGTTLVCQRPGPGELPFFDYSLRQLLDLIPLDKFLKVYSCALLERQILLCSRESQRLMLVAECLSTLLFPFRWQHVYVPILPYSQRLFLEAPLPYIMGLCYEDAPPAQVYQSTVCVVDVDLGRVDPPEDLPLFPDRTELISQVEIAISRFKDSCANTSEEKKEAARDCSTPSVKVNSRSTKRKDDWSLKRPFLNADKNSSIRLSRSFDEDAIGSMLMASNSNEEGLSPALNRMNLAPLPLEVLRESESLAKVREIASRVGVHVGLENVQKELEQSCELYKHSEEARNYFSDIKFNNILREIFLSRFINMFMSYEHFVIGAGGKVRDKESFLTSRDSMQNFDKAAFLSDQPDSQRGFLAEFLETQMFATFVDWKLLAQWERADPNLTLFDRRLADLRAKFGLAMLRTPTYEQAPSFTVGDELISKRQETSDYVVPPPRAMTLSPVSPTESRTNHDGVFPRLNYSALRLREAEKMASEKCNPPNSPWKQRLKHKPPPPPPHQPKKRRPPSLYGSVEHSANSTPAQIASTNMKFVEELLRTTKAKTKRLLVEKMGREAVQLGHTDVSISGLEENTLVATLCDLLERIWAHGLRNKQGKSAIWSHLLAYQELQERSSSFGSRLSKGSHRTLGGLAANSYLTPAMRSESCASELDSANNNDENSAPVSRVGSGFLPVLSYFQGLQRELKNSELTTRSSNTEAAELTTAWSTSLIKAASFICDTIASRVETGVEDSEKELIGKPPRGPPSRERPRRRPSFSLFPAEQQTTGRSQRAASNGRDFSPTAWTATDPMSAEMRGCATLDRRMHKGGAGGVFAQQQLSPQRQRKRSLSRPRSPETTTFLMPLPTSIAYDLKNVLRMTEIKTDIGYARAFLRLSLERKLLHKHLRELLASHEILRRWYKRYAFLRCDDEKEQFLYHILSLNAADFRCFTNTFVKTKVQYQVMVVPGGGRFTMSSTGGAVWILIAGSLGQTPVIRLPAGTLQFTFEHRNLGVLSTLRIGHEFDLDSAGGQSGGTLGGFSVAKWFLDQVLVRNETTGQLYRFPCARWFGRGVDDGSLERLLVAQTLPSPVEGEPNGDDARTPPSRLRSPSTPRKSSTSGLGQIVAANSGGVGGKALVLQVRHQLGDAVNSLVKHFYSATSGSAEQRSAELTRLLCGEGGLVSCIEAAFSVGLRSSRFFQRQQYPWDFVEKVANWFLELLREGQGQQMNRDQRALVKYLVQLVRRISANSALGKQGKFQAFILITVREHVLSGLLPLVAWTPVSGTMYEEPSFLRSPANLGFLTKLLHSLNEFNFVLERSLTYGLDDAEPTIRR